MPDSLDRKRQIDALCDRFEMAWHSAEPPRIEAYLAEATDGDREEVLEELLAAELELRRKRGDACAAAEYRERFPASAPTVDNVFRQAEARAADDPAQLGERCLAAVEAIHDCLLVQADQTAVHSSGSRTSGLHDLADQRIELARQLAGRVRDDAPAAAATAGEVLWLWLLRACRRTGGLDPVTARTLARGLLDAFPPTRRTILTDLLLGHSVRQTAARQRVTERTVQSTHDAACGLLQQ